MTMVDLITILAISVAALTMAGAIGQSRRISSLVGRRQRRRWLFLQGLMLMFQLGYLACIALLLSPLAHWMRFVTAAVFLLGAIFVRLVVQSGYESLAEIVEQRQSLDNILASMSDALLVVGNDGRIRRANRAAGELTGRAPADLTGLPIAQVLQQGGNPVDIGALLGELGTGRNAQGYELVRAQGQSVPVSLAGSVVPDAQGTPLSIVCAARDLRETVELLSRASRAQAAREQAAEFAAMASHELKTPLTSIRGALGILASGGLGEMSPKARQLLDISLSNCERLVRLVNDILDLEKMASGSMSMELHPTPVSELIGQACDEMRAMATAAEVEICEQCQDLTIQVDRDRMVQVLTNLLSNAIKYSEPGSRVEVQCQRSPGHLEVRVVDHGRGIPAEHLETVFMRFSQVERDDSRKKGGTGLGLAICQTIVEQHQGIIWAEPTPGGGATLAFRVPL